MNIQIASDLHLESNDKYLETIIKPSASILCLAGDISPCAIKWDLEIFIKFLKYYCPQFKLILHVAGNHEYYSKKYQHGEECNQYSIQAVDANLRNLRKRFKNYIFLNNQSVEIPHNGKKYIFARTTLWSKIPPRHFNEVAMYMADYHRIYTFPLTKINLSPETPDF